MSTRARICDAWSQAASHRLQQYLMRAALAGRDYAPDQTYELSKAGRVGPISAQIAEIFQRHADLWAEDMRGNEGFGLDQDDTWATAMREAVDEVGRFLAGHKLKGAA